MTKITVDVPKIDEESITLIETFKGDFYRIVSWQQNPDLVGRLVICIGNNSVMMIADRSVGDFPSIWKNTSEQDMRIRLKPVKEVKITVLDR